MFFKKISELFIRDNDVYILETTKDNIIVNDDYKGITLFDHNLNKAKNVFIKDELIITDVYKKFDDAALLLYNNDDNSLAFIDLNTYETITFSIPTHFNNVILSSIYIWVNELIIIRSCDDEFFAITPREKSIKKISVDSVKSVTPDFYHYWIESKNYYLLRTIPQKFALIIDDEKNNKIGFINTKTDKNYFFNRPNSVGHSVDICNQKVLIAYCSSCHVNKEEGISLYDNNEEAVIRIKRPFQFRYTKFLSPTTIIALANNLQNHHESKLIKYEIIEEN